MTAVLRELIERNLATVSAKDVAASVAGFAEDGVLIDPHYPHTRMVGRAEITSGFEWVFANMRELRFDVERCFVVEAEEGLVTRWQAYEPYGPGGIGGLFLGLGKLSYRLRHRI